MLDFPSSPSGYGERPESAVDHLDIKQLFAVSSSWGGMQVLQWCHIIPRYGANGHTNRHLRLLIPATDSLTKWVTSNYLLIQNGKMEHIFP